MNWKWWQRMLWFGGAFTGGFLLFLLVSQCEATQTDMHSEVMWKASTGDLWMKLYKQTLDDETCDVTATTLYTAGASSYARVTFSQDFNSFTPGLAFSGSSDGPLTELPYDICGDTVVYYLWSNQLEDMLLDWAQDSAVTLTIYVGRFTGTAMQTGQDCTTCILQVLYGFQTLALGDGSQPYWEAPAQTVTSAPGGCRPECGLSGAKATQSWGQLKRLYVTP